MRWRWLAVGFGLLSLGLFLVGVSSARLPPHSYREAVMRVLDDQQVAYNDVTVDTSCPPSRHCLSTGTIVIPLTGAVTVSGPRRLHGHMTCTMRTSNGDWTHCTLSITELDLHNLSLPPMAADPSWLGLLRQAWREGWAWWR